MRRYSGHSEASGQFIDVKINAPEVLKKQLDKAKEGKVWGLLRLRPLSTDGSKVWADKTLAERAGEKRSIGGRGEPRRISSK